MKASDLQLNDEVFNLKTRQIGTVINIKELTEPVAGAYARIVIKTGLPDEIWPLEETALWFRQKRYLDGDIK